MKMISVAQDFSRFPAGRLRKDAKHSGQEFREERLIPALQTPGDVVVDMDGTRGYGSSFLEEAFGGLVRTGLFSRENLKRLDIRTSDPFLKVEIQQYMDDAWSRMPNEVTN